MGAARAMEDPDAPRQPRFIYRLARAPLQEPPTARLSIRVPPPRSNCYLFLVIVARELFFPPSISPLSLLSFLARSLTIFSPYSSYCASDHSPWVFALPGLIILLPVVTFPSAATSHVSRAAALLFFCSRLAPLASPEHLLTNVASSLSSRFIINLLSSVYLSSFSCLHPVIPSDTTPSPGDGASYICMRDSFRNLRGVPPPFYGLLGRRSQLRSRFLPSHLLENFPMLDMSTIPIVNTQST